MFLSSLSFSKSEASIFYCRIAYALETHGVEVKRLAPAPTAAQLAPPKPLLSGEAAAAFIKWSPYFLVGLVYLATSYVRWKKVRAAWASGVSCRAAPLRRLRVAGLPGDCRCQPLQRRRGPLRRSSAACCLAARRLLCNTVTPRAYHACPARGQGDMEDRIKLRKKAEEEARRRAREERQDQVLSEAADMRRQVRPTLPPPQHCACSPYAPC